MMLSRNFPSLALLSLVAACGGSVEQIGGGDGDGDGDGDTYGDGDGDGDVPIGDGDGDLIYPGDGDGDGDTSGGGGYYGDGDGDGDGDIVVPGVGGGRPIPGVGGSGGGIIVPPPTGGGPGVIPIGPPIDPDTCTPTYSYNDRNYCERQVDCSGTYAYVYCDSYSGTSNCTCDRNGAYFSVAVDSSFIEGGKGCDRMMDACLGGGELEVVGDTVCQTSYLDQSQTYCGTNLSCQTPVEFGGTTGSIQTWSDAWCDNYNDEWVCNCYTGNTSGQLKFSDELVSPDVCFDAIGACAGPLIDPDIPLTCAPRSQWAQGTQCNFELECTQERTINGNQVDVSAWQYGGCQLQGDDKWDCSCGGAIDSVSVVANTAWDACSSASVQCGL